MCSPLISCASKVVVNDPVTARHIMVTRGYFYGKHEGVRVVFRWIEGSKFGMGSLEGEVGYFLNCIISYIHVYYASFAGEDHKRVRKMMLHTFTPAHIRTLHPTVREYADQFVEVISKEREVVEHDMLKYFKHVALDISKYEASSPSNAMCLFTFTVGIY